MKPKLFFLILLFLIPFGCKEEKEIEVITDYDQVYLDDKKLDQYPELINGNSDQLIDTVMSVYRKKYPFMDKYQEKATIEYKYLINENGSIDKIIVGKDNDKEINELVSSTVKNWNYGPAKKDGKIVKWQSGFALWEIANLEVNDKDYFQSADEMPEPIGGMKSIQEKIMYPDSAKKNGIEGKVFLTAFINEVGNVVSVKIIKGIGYGCDDAAMSAVHQTKFKPGLLGSKPVKVQVTIPIVFKLQ
jgi:TonB family protein